MKKRNIVRLVSFLSAIIVALCGVIIKTQKNTENLKLQIENNYSHSLNEFSASMNNISLILKKTRYATTPAVLCQMAAELLTETEISKTALSQLPASASLHTLNRFLSQAGNYAFSISAKLYGGEKLPGDFQGNITTLSETAETVSKIVTAAQINFDNPDYWVKEIEKKIDSNIDENLTSSLQKIEGELSDYPTLVYDGPYSDHLLNEQPAILSDAKEITRKKAESVACAFLGEEKLSFISEDNGKIQAYRFGEDGVNIAVSKLDGHVTYMRKDRMIENNILTYSQALSKAKRFLENNSLNNFLETYYFIDEGVCVINFAYLDGATVCYTDLIKVGIAMDNGEVMFYEASGYLSNHKTRAFETVKITEDKAKQNVSKELKINKTALALIPTDRGEVRCYEFSCVDGETEVLVYINVLTGEQEQILILLKNDGGMLAK